MTAIKICGLTRREDVDAALEAGAGMIGLIFAPQSPRVISVDQAQRLAARVPDDKNIVGVFMNQDVAKVTAILAEINLDILQFHGEEENDWCGQFGLPFFKAVSMHEPANLVAVAQMYPDAFALLLDSHEQGEAGGQGRVFDWSAIGRKLATPVMLAGGLNSGNVQDAVQRVRPWAVDVSSGVEMAPGIKDHALMYEFCQQVMEADGEPT